MASPTFRMLSNQRSGGAMASIDGHKVNVALNNTIDVPFEVAQTMQGWGNMGQVGPSTARPQNASYATHFIDTTLSKVIFYDGNGGWHDPFTGALV